MIQGFNSICQGGPKMKKIGICLLAAGVAVALGFSMALALAQQEKKPAQKPQPVTVKNVDEATCYGCHTEIQALKGKGKHAKGLNCAVCHPETSAHLSDSAKKPVTRLDPEACASCHK